MQEIIFVAHIMPLLQHMLVFLGLAYLFTKTPVFTALVNNSLSLPDKVVIYLIFSGFCALGTYFSEQAFHSDDAISNTRAIGAVLGGLLGGPLVGLLVGMTGGLHRLFSLSSASDPINFIDVACAVATTCEGLFAGCIHSLQMRRGKIDQLFAPHFALLVTLLAETGHMSMLLLFGFWFGDVALAWALVREIALPMLLANSTGVALIIYLIREQRCACDELSSKEISWQIANKISAILPERFDQSSSHQIAEIVRQQSKVGAVAITNRQHLLAFAGLGAEHHRPGTEISSTDTLWAMDENQVVFVDGVDKSYQCRISNDCPLGSALIIPLRDEAANQVFGAIKLYEPRNKLFRNINRKLGEDIAQLISTGILASRYQTQQQLRLQDQYKILTAQINPHFLYNALTTISHITRHQSERARQLLQHLSDFFRNNLEQAGDSTTLQHELSHVNAYLEIERARFEDRLQIEVSVPDSLLMQRLPVFTLQPIVENAIKHGISQLLSTGVVKISASEGKDSFSLQVEDNAGLYGNQEGSGIGLTIDDRIKLAYGEMYGLEITCDFQQWTRVNIVLPLNRELR